MLTPEERSILNNLADAWNGFAALPDDCTHPMDREEFCHAVHQAQNIVLARSGVRDLERGDPDPLEVNDEDDESRK